MDISEQTEVTEQPAKKTKTRKVAKRKVAAAQVDAEETPQSLHRKKLAAEREERKANTKVEKEWYERAGTKIVKKILMSNGNLHTQFVCMDNAKNKSVIESLKQQMKVQSKEL